MLDWPITVVDAKYSLEWNDQTNTSDLVWWQKVASKEEVDKKLAEESINPTLGINRLVNAKMLWRHNHPIDCHLDGEPCFVVGYVDDVKILNEDVHAKLRVEGWTQAHRHFQHIVVEPKAYGFDNLGFSVQTWSYRLPDDPEGVKRLHWEEVSLTPYPHCKTCNASENKNVSRIVKQKIGAFEMSENQPTGTNAKDDTKILVDTIKEMESSIKEISTKYDESLETIQKMEGTIKDQKAKIEFLVNKKPLLEKIATFEKNTDQFKDFSTDHLKIVAELLAKQKSPAADVVIETITTAQDDNRKKDYFAKLKDVSPELYAQIKAEAKEKGKDLKEIAGE